MADDSGLDEESKNFAVLMCSLSASKNRTIREVFELITVKCIFDGSNKE